MEQFEKDVLSDGELQGLLHLWKVPDPPARLREGVFGPSRRTRRWQVWSASIRVPVPVLALLALAFAIGFWKWPRQGVVRESLSRVEVKTVRVEVPVVKREVVTRVVYRDRTSRQAEEDQELRPVTELRPRIIGSQK